MTVRLEPTGDRARRQAPELPTELPPELPADALRPMLQSLIQETLEREFTHFLGAGPHERRAERRGWRNGRRDRTLLTRVGPLTLRVPRDRAGEFQPALFERYQRSEQALVLALAERYLQGVSTRKVSAVVAQLCGTTISASTVSACTRRLDASLAAWRARRLDATSYPYLVLDAHHERIRREGQVLSTVALCRSGPARRQALPWVNSQCLTARSAGCASCASESAMRRRRSPWTRSLSRNGTCVSQNVPTHRPSRPIVLRRRAHTQSGPAPP